MGRDAGEDARAWGIEGATGAVLAHLAGTFIRKVLLEESRGCVVTATALEHGFLLGEEKRKKGENEKSFWEEVLDA